MFRITVNAGGPFAPADENLLYLAPAWEITEVDVGSDDGPGKPVRMVKFTPRNGPGHEQGREHYVPYERLVAVVDLEAD